MKDLIETQTLYINSACKPSKDHFINALELMGTNSEQTIMIGDTLFSDIRGANCAGLKSIMVKYIGYYSSKSKGIKRHKETYPWPA